MADGIKLGVQRVKGGLYLSVYLFLRFKRRYFDDLLPSCFETHICECCNFSSCNFKTNRNKNNAKDLQGITFSQLALDDKTKISYNLGRATPYVVIPMSQSYSAKCKLM